MLIEKSNANLNVEMYAFRFEYFQWTNDFAYNLKIFFLYYGG